jgi:hypothetical protein
MARSPSRRQQLLRQMFAEVEAARLLYLDDLLTQAELHLCRARDAQACVLALGGSAPSTGESSHVSKTEDEPSGEGLTRRELWNQLRATARAHRQLARQAWMERMGLDGRGRKVAAAATVVALLLAMLLGVRHIWTSYKPPPVPENLVLPLVPTYSTLFIRYADLQQPMVEETKFDAQGTHGFGEMARVLLGQVRRARTMEISLDANDAYTLRLLRQGRVVARMVFPPNPDLSGLRVERREVPAAAVKAGYDHIEITCDKGDGIHFIGHLILDGDMEDSAPDAGVARAG